MKAHLQPNAHVYEDEYDKLRGMVVNYMMIKRFDEGVGVVRWTSTTSARDEEREVGRVSHYFSSGSRSPLANRTRRRRSRRRRIVRRNSAGGAVSEAISLVAASSHLLRARAFGSLLEVVIGPARKLGSQFLKSSQNLEAGTWRMRKSTLTPDG